MKSIKMQIYDKLEADGVGKWHVVGMSVNKPETLTVEKEFKVKGYTLYLSVIAPYGKNVVTYHACKRNEEVHYTCMSYSELKESLLELGTDDISNATPATDADIRRLLAGRKERNKEFKEQERDYIMEEFGDEQK
jgi:hypothetical protein